VDTGAPTTRVVLRDTPEVADALGWHPREPAGSRAVAMTPRHDAVWQCGDSTTMEASERPLPKQQVADLAALKAISEFRQGLPAGSPKRIQALREEDELIARVVAWASQRPSEARRR